MKAIVTGAFGFVGSALVKELISNGFEVLCIDKVINKDRIVNDKRIKTLELSIENIEDLKKIIKANEYDLFYHFAWLGSAGPMRSDPEIQTTNALLTLKCLKVANDLGCKKFIMAGSITEFEAYEAIYSQSTKPSVNYIYGAGKILAHLLCKPIANTLKIDLVWAYITNAYGVGELSPRLVNTTLSKIINNEKLEFTLGIQNYDFLYIDDVAKAFYLLGINGKPNKNYIIGSGNAMPLKGFLEKIISTVSPNYPTVFGDIKFTGTNLSLETYSIEELKRDCGFSPSISFEEGIKRTYSWLKEINK